MSTEKIREEFEAAIVSEFKFVGCEGGPDLCRSYNNGNYLNQVVGGAWWAWQASRAAIEVELPTSLEYTGSGSAIDACREAIESLGVKVKPC